MHASLSAGSHNPVHVRVVIQKAASCQNITSFYDIFSEQAEPYHGYNHDFITTVNIGDSKSQMGMNVSGGLRNIGPGG
jgi:hypothetical protein